MVNPTLALGLSLMTTMSMAVALAQEPAAHTPGPEHKAIGYFEGKWTTEGSMKPGPHGPGGKITSQDSCEWFKGGFHIVCRSSGTGPAGPMTSMGVLAYSSPDKAYTYYGIDNTGLNEMSKGTKSGNTWTFTAKSSMGGQTFHSRYTIVETAPTAYTFKWDTSPDGTQWQTVAQGTSKKAAM